MTVLVQFIPFCLQLIFYDHFIHYIHKHLIVWGQYDFFLCACKTFYRFIQQVCIKLFKKDIDIMLQMMSIVNKFWFFKIPIHQKMQKNMYHVFHTNI